MTPEAASQAPSSEHLGWAELEPREPVMAGSLGTWRITYHAGAYGLDDGGAILIARRFASDWGDPQLVDPSAPNFTTATTSADAALEVRYDPDGYIRPWQKAIVVRIRDGFLAPDDTVTVVLGDTSGGGPGSEAQSFCEARFEFKVLVDPFGTGAFAELGSAGTLNVVSGPATALSVIVPTDIALGELFSVKLRFHDRWGNVADSHTGRLTTVSAAVLEGLPALAELRESHAGVLELDSIQAVSPGTLTVEVRDEAAGLAATSNTATVHQQGRRLRRFWGDMHGQSGEGVGTGTVDEYFAFARDRALVDFAGHQTNCFQVTEDAWRRIREATRHYHAPGRFVTFLGYEWSGLTPAGGDRNVYFLSDDGPLHRASSWLAFGERTVATDRYPVSQLYEELSGRNDVLLVPHVGGRSADLRLHDPALEPLIEIYSSHGEFEWLLADALERGYRVGVSCGSDEHKGRPGASYAGRGIFGVRGGLLCVLADKLTREAVWEALRSRRCYGTTGERIALLFEANGVPMGGVIPAAGPVSFNVAAGGTAEIERVELRRGTACVDVFPKPVRRSDDAIRISWSGARNRGRARAALWDGSITCEGTRIVAVRPYAFDSPAEGILHHSDREIAWRSATSGDADGVILTLDPPCSGTLAFSTQIVDFALSLEELDQDPIVHEAGGVGLTVTVERDPQGVGREVTVTLADPAPPDSPAAYYVMVLQRDGAKAWSSPIWVEPRG
jgi:hypothetical protein